MRGREDAIQCRRLCCLRRNYQLPHTDVLCVCVCMRVGGWVSCVVRVVCAVWVGVLYAYVVCAACVYMCLCVRRACVRACSRAFVYLRVGPMPYASVCVCVCVHARGWV